MKVIYLNPSGQLGGAERVLLSILASLSAAEPLFEPHLIAGADGPLIGQTQALGVPATVIPFPPALARLGDCGAGGPAGRQVSAATLLGRLLKAGGAVIFYLIRLRRALKQLAPDIIHTNGFKMHLLGLWARPRRTPVIWHMHDYISARPLMARALPRFVKHCAAIIAISNSVAEDARKVCGNATPIFTVYNAIDLSNFTPVGPQLDLDKLSGLPPAPPKTIKVSMLATMARWKGHEVFLKAIAQLPTEWPIRAYVIGDALYQTDGSQCSIPELRQMAATLGLTEKVGFTGFVSDSASAMRASNIIVHASTQPEPFGLVIVEAMACGRAVIISNAGGAAELIEKDHSALTHQPGDRDELAACLARLVTDHALCQELGNAGHSRAQIRFSLARLTRDLFPIYLRLTAASPVAAEVFLIPNLEAALPKKIR